MKEVKEMKCPKCGRAIRKADLYITMGDDYIDVDFVCDDEDDAKGCGYHGFWRCKIKDMLDAN